MMRHYRAAIICAAVTVVCLVPFANKAFHLDDPLFLWSAKQIQTHPTDFFGFSINWYGGDRPMAEVTKNPPLACYYIALAASLFGWSEVPLHIAFLIPAVLAALGTCCLAGKFCSRPVQASLAAVLTPAFLVSSTNVMCDTMMLAFWVWALFLWIEGIEKNSHWRLSVAAVLVALCALTKYFGITLLPLLLVYSLVRKRRPGVWTLWLLVPVAILAGYQWAMHSLYGHGWVTDVAAYAVEARETDMSTFSLNGLSSLCFLGGCIVTALFYSPLLYSKRVLAGGIVLAILLGIIGFAAKIVPDTGGVKWASLVQAGLMAAAGISILWLTGADLWKSRNAGSLLLLLWVFGTFLFAGFINWTTNARSILPMAPAVGILLMRQIERRNDKPVQQTGQAKQAKQVKQVTPAMPSPVQRAIWPLIPAAIVSLLVCYADYSWADTSRSAAKSIGEQFKDSGRTVWFQGHWGFQYYMEAAGGKPLNMEKLTFMPADVIVTPSNNTNVYELPESSLSLYKVMELTPCQRLATMSGSLGAGFYANSRGLLPYVAGQVETENYRIFALRLRPAR
jgi:4-amino-4-deoxy-L-arabinose transferase-like glycosyltransferase